MRQLVRLSMSVSIAAITATAIAVAPPAPPNTPPERATTTGQVVSLPLRFSAQVQPLTALPNVLTEWVERIVVPPSLGAPVPAPPAEPTLSTTSIGSAIINTYNAIEPWVQYGFELATYAVGWVPFVGWLAPQIMIVYNFGERIARSITYNFANWIDGNVSFVQGLVNIGTDTVDSFIQLGIDEWNFFLPPLPPLPFATTEVEDVEPAMTMRGTEPVLDTPDSFEVATEQPALREARVHEAGVEVDPTQEPIDKRPTTPIDDTNEAAEEADEESAEDEDPLNETTDEQPTTSTVGGVQAQGEVRGAPQDAQEDGAGAQESPGRSGGDDAPPDNETAEAESSTDVSAGETTDNTASE